MQLHYGFYYLLVKVFTRLTSLAFLEITEDIRSHFKNQCLYINVIGVEVFQATFTGY